MFELSEVDFFVREVGGMVEGSMTYQELLSVLVAVELQISFIPSCMYICMLWIALLLLPS